MNPNFNLFMGSAQVHLGEKPESHFELFVGYNKIILIILNGERVLSENILFASSSAAAKFVAGSSVSGNVCWKNADGILLKSLQK